MLLCNDGPKTALDPTQNKEVSLKDLRMNLFPAQVAREPRSFVLIVIDKGH